MIKILLERKLKRIILPLVPKLNEKLSDRLMMMDLLTSNSNSRRRMAKVLNLNPKTLMQLKVREHSGLSYVILRMQS